MPVAFALGFQNNFHLLSVNRWQPWEPGVKAPRHQPSLAVWSWAFPNAHFSSLGLHTELRVGLVSSVIAVIFFTGLEIMK